MYYIIPFPSGVCIFLETCKYIQGLPEYILCFLVAKKVRFCILKTSKEMVLAKRKTWIPELQKEEWMLCWNVNISFIKKLIMKPKIPSNSSILHLFPQLAIFNWWNIFRLKIWSMVLWSSIGFWQVPSYCCINKMHVNLNNTKHDETNWKGDKWFLWDQLFHLRKLRTSCNQSGSIQYLLCYFLVTGKHETGNTDWKIPILAV